jgi:hypothetical protein
VDSEVAVVTSNVIPPTTAVTAVSLGKVTCGKCSSNAFSFASTSSFQEVGVRASGEWKIPLTRLGRAP